ncbi:hypothetical protein LX87_05639 [Larkinella arboricola]|uniref:Uncharacterized protein n=1 Tax=Larkinella arboricola TaxID=643671 RepID=A0A327WF94_LARAB|nr:hypothetical protein LX87_05639 [Larkinella arboricola]
MEMKGLDSLKRTFDKVALLYSEIDHKRKNRLFKAGFLQKKITWFNIS